MQPQSRMRLGIRGEGDQSVINTMTRTGTQTGKLVLNILHELFFYLDFFLDPNSNSNALIFFETFLSSLLHCLFDVIYLSPLKVILRSSAVKI